MFRFYFFFPTPVELCSLFHAQGTSGPKKKIVKKIEQFIVCTLQLAFEY